MNTKDDKIQWHPAFDAALQIELGDEAKYLEFESEHMLTKKPMQISVFCIGFLKSQFNMEKDSFRLEI